MPKYTYHKGSANTHEIVEYDIEKAGRYVTTCAIDIQLLICGINTFPCGNGDDIKLTTMQQQEVLMFAQSEREKIVTADSIKSLEGWRKSGLPTWEDYCKPGEIVTDDVVDYFRDSVPPVTMRAGYLQAGEAFDIAPDDNDIMRSTYTTFSYHSTNNAGQPLWLHNGPCFKNGTTSKANTKTQLERRLEAVSAELKKDCPA